MSTQESRPAIDLAPTRAPQPTLALVLALLAVPGSTVAWDLPLGGLWIGLPLALAAIVLGLRARREGAGPKRSTAAVVVAALCIAQMVVWTAVSLAGQADQGGTLTIRELDRGSTFTHIRNTEGAPGRANLQGDVIAFTNPLADSSGKRIGKLSMACVTTTGARNFMRSVLTCHGTLALPGGKLMVQADVRVRARTTVGVVTGGTGAYANARGVVESRTTGSGAVDTITFAEG
jgi:hypothetical protein